MAEWQPIETAPKGGTDIVPVLLATFGNKERFDGMAVGYFDLYYAEGGSGYEGGNGWVILEGEEYRLHYHGPTHWMPLPPPASGEVKSWNDPVGSSRCDVCGIDTPHGHTEFDILQQRYARPAFEKRYARVVTSSWDGDTSSIGPQRRGPSPEDGYWGQEDDRRWQTYVNAWWDAWKHFSELQRCALQSSGGAVDA